MKNPELVERLMSEASAGVSSNVPLVVALEFRRDQYGLSQRQFARILGIQPSHYSEFISGERGLSLRALRRACAIGVPANVLLQGKG
jgi:transcriptional regulator with XRE-family HTH domain